MSKRKRAPKSADDSATTPAGEAAGGSGDDASAKDDMVHVTSDMLAGSPDIFAPRKATSDQPEPEEAAAEPVTENLVEPPEAEASVEPEEPAAPPAGPEPHVDSTALAPQPPQVTPPPPPFAHVERQPAQGRRGSSSAAIGVVLIVLGVFALAIVLSGVDLSQYGWPLFVLVPGLTLLVLGFVGMGAIASLPGGVVTMLGLVLAYQNATNDWPTWAFAWSLIIPFGLGLGIYLQALRDRDVPALRRGRTLMFGGLMIFVFGFVFFESILGISGRDYGGLGKAALPLLLILIGLVLLVRSIQRSRRTA